MCDVHYLIRCPQPSLTSGASFLLDRWKKCVILWSLDVLPFSMNEKKVRHDP